MVWFVSTESRHRFGRRRLAATHTQVLIDSAVENEANGREGGAQAGRCQRQTHTRRHTYSVHRDTVEAFNGGGGTRLIQARLFGRTCCETTVRSEMARVMQGYACHNGVAKEKASGEEGKSRAWNPGV